MTDVTLDNVFIGQRVKQGRYWRSKWRDNIDKTSTTIPKKRVIGTVIGYIKDGIIIGKNTTRIYNTLNDRNITKWCCVVWDNGNESVYSIGNNNLYSLIIQ